MLIKFEKEPNLVNKCKIVMGLFICIFYATRLFLTVNTIMVAKPEKGRQVESVIVQMATSGQIGGKLSENDLIGLVERVNAQTQKTTTVKVS